ncbi:MAG: LD-carboxypeptidase [Lentisphaerae bacterium]|nr:LD-carboxypeptidase [Lentisphaerota bacterium]
MFKIPQKYRIALVSPSGRCDEATVIAGKNVLEKCGCEVTVMPHVFAGDSLPHLSASDENRAGDINRALADKNIDMLWAVRGGAGALRILEKINWPLWQKRQLPLAGFSDISALHWAMDKYGINSYLAAPMMKFLSSATDGLTANSLCAALNGENISLKLSSLRAGNICGTPLPGNIAVAASLCGSCFFPDTAGKILILEEVGERPYRLDRMLTQLRLAGTFKRCAGVIFGNLTDCDTSSGVMEILQDFTAGISCPVFYGLEHGHELPFHAFSGRQVIAVSAK